MKGIFILFTSIVFVSLHAQQLHFQNEPVEAIEISAFIKTHQWGWKDTTCDKQACCSIIFQEQTQSYQLSAYEKSKCSSRYQRSKQVEKVKTLSKSKFISNKLLSDLLKSFEAGTITPFSKNCGISKEQFDNLTNQDNLLKIIKKHKLKKNVLPTKFNNAEIVEISNVVQNIDTFELYLTTRIAKPTINKPINKSNRFVITINTRNDEYQFSASLIMSSYQPWHVVKSGKPLSIQVLNFNTHQLLGTLLPKSFLLRDSLLPSALIEDYLLRNLIRMGFIWNC